ncbi:hypothetical protein HRbin29_01038 [bacterium HR29]|jgi:putative membrane protein|nr:hypothetical protein HRbin29_01038 [bacterium HR29]
MTADAGPARKGTSRYPEPVLGIAAQFLRGFAMGCADVVPGVSGATVALALGIYEPLVAAIRRFVAIGVAVARLDGRRAAREFRRAPWRFTLPLVAGIATAFLTLAHVIEAALDRYPVELAALFFGLVAGSIGVAWSRLRDRGGLDLALLLASAGASFLALGVRSGEVSDPAWWFVPLSGALAICAMILPGISGSFVLLMLGMYEYMLGALNNRDLPVVALFAVGVAAGLATFVPALEWMLKRWHDRVLAAMIGLMLGSLRVVWPWPQGTDSAALGAPVWGDVPAAGVLALGGALLVLGLARWSARAQLPAPARRVRPVAGR